MQMGISFLCCLGYGIPLHPSCNCGFLIREKATRSFDARVVHETGRSDPGIRMEF